MTEILKDLPAGNPMILLMVIVKGLEELLPELVVLLLEFKLLLILKFKNIPPFG